MNGIQRIARQTSARFGRSLLLLGSVAALAALASVPAQAQAKADPGNLTEYRGQVGQSFDFTVTGRLTGAVWGTDVYTDDSHLGTAAVHAGALRDGQQGVVRVTMLAGQDRYDASTRNGVTSSSYGSWYGSYRVAAVSNTPASQATLRVQKALYAPNEAIVVEYQGLPGNASDWVSLAKVGAPNNQNERWSYTNGERSGSRTLQGLPAGNYEARVYFNWPTGDFNIQARYLFTVGTAPAPATSGNFAGVWWTDLGFYMGFVQNGTSVTGYYWADGQWYRLLTGTVSGNVMTGQWDLSIADGSFQFVQGTDSTGRPVFDAAATGLYGWVTISFSGSLYSR